MKSLESSVRSVRLWFALLFISGAVMSAIWAEPIDNGGHPGPEQQFENCWADMGDCNDSCTKQGGSQDCYGQCYDDFNSCTSKINWNAVGVGKPGQTPPPNETGANPTSSPSPSSTPRKYPIKGPPRKLGPNPVSSPGASPSGTLRKHPIRPPKRLGPSPSPSGSAKPILLAKPKSSPSPKPTPKKKDHDHEHDHSHSNGGGHH